MYRIILPYLGPSTNSSGAVRAGSGIVQPHAYGLTFKEVEVQRPVCRASLPLLLQLPGWSGADQGEIDVDPAGPYYGLRRARELVRYVVHNIMQRVFSSAARRTEAGCGRSSNTAAVS